MRLTITDSGLGGLSICAALERDLRTTPLAGQVALTYVNAWPEDGRGYNDLADDAERAAVFDRVLAAIAATRPDALLIACNTLSILYGATAFSRSAPIPVRGIIQAGVELFLEALRARPDASIVLIGTKTTMASGVHQAALVAAGVPAERIAAVSCHGLATAVERDVDGPRVGELIAVCASDVRKATPAGSAVLLGLCCTHYGYVSERLATAVSTSVGRDVTALDPNRRMVEGVVAELASCDAGPAGLSRPAVEVVSKVALDERTRTGIAALLRPVSPATADALKDYRHTPDLF